MTRLKLLTAASCTVALASLLTMTGAAQNVMNQRTFLTFSGPVELPGITLPAGRYLFRLADSPSNRNIVQVLSEDEQKMHATILAISAERLQPSDETVVTFGERPAGTPPAVKLWFYPGDTIGHEFVYPHDQALKIARESSQTVLSGESNDKDTKLTRIAPTGEETAYNEEEQTRTSQRAANETTPPATGTTGTTTTTESATGTSGSAGQAATAEQSMKPEEHAAMVGKETAPSSPQPSASGESMTPEEHAAMVNKQAAPSQAERATGTAGTATQEETAPAAGAQQRLPKTASPLPLAGLLGLLAMGGALGLRLARIRS